MEVRLAILQVIISLDTEVDGLLLKINDLYFLTELVQHRPWKRKLPLHLVKIHQL